KRSIGQVDAVFTAGRREISPHLFLADFSSFIRRAICRPYSRPRGVERLSDINNAKAGNYEGGRSRRKHPPGPIGHIPLGAQIFFIAPLIPLGLFIGYSGFRQRSAVDGAILLIGGSVLAAIAITFLIANF